MGTSCCSGESLRDPPEAFFSPAIESLCVGEYQVPGAHRIQHQQLMRAVLAGEIDHEDSGAADKADVREDMDHGSRGQLTGARRCFHDGTVHTMEELGDPLIGGFGLVQMGIGSFAEEVVSQILGCFPRGHCAGIDERLTEIPNPVPGDNWRIHDTHSSFRF